MTDQDQIDDHTLTDVVDDIDDLIADDELDQAGDCLEQAFGRFGRVDELVVRAADIALDVEEYDRCIAGVDEALGDVDDSTYRARLLAAKGYALYYVDDIDAARQTFNQAVSADGELWMAIVGRAMVHDYLDFHRAAMIDLDRAVAIDDQEGQPFAIRGMIHLHFGDLDEARRDLGYAVESDPWDEECRLNLARLQALDGQSSQARETLGPLIGDGEDPVFVAPGAALRSQLALGLGSADAAAADARVVIDLLGDQPWGYLALAAALITGGQGGEAVAVLKDAESQMANARDFPDLHALRAAAYDQIGKVDKAQREHAKAEGASRLPEFVYGGQLNPSRNVPVNPNKPIDVRSIMRQIFDDPDQAPDGYEDAIRDVLDQLPEHIEENPELSRVEIELPQFEGMDQPPGSLVIELDNAPAGS